MNCQAHSPNPLTVYTIDIHIWLCIWSSRSNGAWATLWVDPDEKAGKSLDFTARYSCAAVEVSCWGYRFEHKGKSIHVFL